MGVEFEMSVLRSIIIGCVFLLVPTILGASSIPLAESDYAFLKKVTVMEHFQYETYLKTDQGLASVLGYHFDWYFTERVFGVLAIFGAVGGDRGGYGIASFGAGYTRPLGKRLAWDARFLVGSGGGGGLPAGGGFALEGLAGIRYALTKSLSLESKIGYLMFPTGDFETMVFNVGVSYRKQFLYLPWKE